jgi:hypothetical protein
MRHFLAGINPQVPPCGHACLYHEPGTVIHLETHVPTAEVTSGLARTSSSLCHQEMMAVALEIIIDVSQTANITITTQEPD